MKPDDFTSELDRNRNMSIKQALSSAAPPVKDFSDPIMTRIERLDSPGTLHAPRKAPLLTMKRLAITLGAIGLLCGFSYAANEWLSLKDSAGNAVMEVRTTDSKIPEWQIAVLQNVEKQIAQGDSAVVYFGSKEQILNKKTDQILWTSSPIEYRDFSKLIDAVKGPLSGSRLSIHVPEGYEFEAGYLYMDYQPHSQENDQLTFAKTPDGKEYAYGLRKPGNKIQSVALKYRKGAQEISYSVLFQLDAMKLFVMNPSKDFVIDIGGTEAYYLNGTLRWVEKSAGGFMNYSLTGPDAAQEQLIDFAKTILAR